MQWLLAKTNQVAADAIVDDTLLCEISQIKFHLVNANAGGDDHWKLACTVKTSIQVVSLKNCKYKEIKSTTLKAKYNQMTIPLRDMLRTSRKLPCEAVEL